MPSSDRDVSNVTANGGAPASKDGDDNEGGIVEEEGSMKESKINKGKDGHGDGKEAHAEAKATTSGIETEMQANKSINIKSEQMV